MLCPRPENVLVKANFVREVHITHSLKQLYYWSCPAWSELPLWMTRYNPTTKLVSLQIFVMEVKPGNCPFTKGIACLTMRGITNKVETQILPKATEASLKEKERTSYYIAQNDFQIVHDKGYCPQNWMTLMRKLLGCLFHLHSLKGAAGFYWRWHMSP